MLSEFGDEEEKIQKSPKNYVTVIYNAKKYSN